MTHRPALLAAALLASAAWAPVGCSSEAVTSLDAGPTPDAGPGPGDGGHPTDAAEPSDAGALREALFDRTKLMRVDLELDPTDWDTLRAQTRSLATTLARPDCLATPFESPFTYFPARLTVDGTTFGQVGLRKKGFLGSLSDVKPSLKVKLDEYVRGQEYLGAATLVLNNGRQDPTLIKPCLALDVFRAAGLPAPRCSYAEVFVNGAPLGPYVHVETIDKRFLRAELGGEDGQLYEGTISDFREGWLGTFEQETNEATPYDRSDLLGLTSALEVGDAELLAALDPWIDLDELNRFWAAEVLVEHWDGYSGNTNNFYVYNDPSTGRFRFIPWGLDGILTGRPPPYSVLAEGLLVRRLYLHPEGKRRYLAALDRLLREVWDAEEVLAKIDHAEALVAPAVPEPARAEARAATEALRAFVRGREGQLRGELDAGGASWPNPLRGPLCFDQGRLDAHLTTTFGTHPAPNIFVTGTGTMTATIGADHTEGIDVGASAGFGENPDDLNDAVLLMAATSADGSIPVVYVAMSPERLAPGRVFIDGQTVRGALLRFPRPGAPLEVVAFLWTGFIDIAAGAPVMGASIDASIHAELLRNQQ